MVICRKFEQIIKYNKDNVKKKIRRYESDLYSSFLSIKTNHLIAKNKVKKECYNVQELGF